MPVTEPTEDDAPIVRFVNLLICQAINDRASRHPHRAAASATCGVRYRIDGVLHEMQRASPSAIQAGVISRLKIMADIDIAERRKPQDGRLSVEVHRPAGSTSASRRCPRCAARRSSCASSTTRRRASTRRSSSAAPERNAASYKASYTKPYGMILVTGPTGSGKSTTLYAALHEVARPRSTSSPSRTRSSTSMPGHQPGAGQPQGGADLRQRAALRSCAPTPTSSLLGEIRDHETAQIAIEAALTGHLVLTTLHTNDAPGAVTRLIEMGIEPFLVGSALDCVVAQRLARRLCEECKQPYQPDLAELHDARVPVDPTLGTRRSCTSPWAARRVLEHGLPRPHGAPRGHVRHRGHRAARRGSAPSSAEIGRVAIAQGMNDAASGRLGEGAARADAAIDEILRVVA